MVRRLVEEPPLVPPLNRPSPPSTPDGSAAPSRGGAISKSVKSTLLNADLPEDSSYTPEEHAPNVMIVWLHAVPHKDAFNEDSAGSFPVRCNHHSPKGAELAVMDAADPSFDSVGAFRAALARQLMVPVNDLRLLLPNGRALEHSVDASLVAELVKEADELLKEAARQADSPDPPIIRDGFCEAGVGAAELGISSPPQPQTSLSRGPPQRTVPKAGTECDTAELALLARLHGIDPSGAGEKEHTFAQAVDRVLWALNIAQRGPTGAAKRPTVVPWGLVARVFCAAVALVIAMLALLSLTRANFKEISVSEDGLLLARGVPSYFGAEPIAATASAIEVRELQRCAGLPHKTLQNIKDVELVYKGVWRSIRVAHVVKFSDSHVWFEAPDGTGLRIRGSEVFLREGKLGDEQPLNLGGEIYGGNATKTQVVHPRAYFDVVAQS